MKKLVSILLVIGIILSLGAAAFAEAVGITVTRNPVSVSCRAGEMAWFYANADSYETVAWSFIAPSGLEVSLSEFRSLFPIAIVAGENSTSLSVSNVPVEMDGWAVCCRFHNSIDNASTQWAFFSVSEAPAFGSGEAYFGW